MFSENKDQSFLGFLAVLISVVLLVVFAWIVVPNGPEMVITALTRLMDQAVGGLIAILGMAAQAVFRHSQTEKNLAEAAKLTAEKVPPVTGEARESLNDTTTTS